MLILQDPQSSTQAVKKVAFKHEVEDERRYMSGAKNSGPSSRKNSVLNSERASGKRMASEANSSDKAFFK